MPDPIRTMCYHALSETDLNQSLESAAGSLDRVGFMFRVSQDGNVHAPFVRVIPRVGRHGNGGSPRRHAARIGE